MNTVETLLDAIDRVLALGQAKGRRTENSLVVVNSAALEVLGSTELHTEFGPVTIGMDDTVPDGEAMIVHYGRHS